MEMVLRSLSATLLTLNNRLNFLPSEQMLHNTLTPHTPTYTYLLSRVSRDCSNALSNFTRVIWGLSSDTLVWRKGLSSCSFCPLSQLLHLSNSFLWPWTVLHLSFTLLLPHYIFYFFPTVSWGFYWLFLPCILLRILPIIICLSHRVFKIFQSNIIINWKVNSICIIMATTCYKIHQQKCVHKWCNNFQKNNLAVESKISNSVSKGFLTPSD